MPDAVTYHSDQGKKKSKEKVSSLLDCPHMLVMKHFNTCNIWLRNILELLTPKPNLSDNRCYIIYALCKAVSSLYRSVTEVMFWFIMYMNKSIKGTHRECVHFHGLKSMVLFTFKNKYCSSCSRFRAHIVSTVILTDYECTHKATTR